MTSVFHPMAKRGFGGVLRNVGWKARNVSVARGRLLERNRDIARDEMRAKRGLWFR